MNKMKRKTKDLESPWITKGIKKSSKKSNVLFEIFKKKKEKKKSSGQKGAFF